MEKPVYLDYNATTPIDPEVANEMIPYIQTSLAILQVHIQLEGTIRKLLKRHVNR